MRSKKKFFSLNYGSPLAIILFLLPGVGLYTLFMLYPSMQSLYYSVINWQGGPIANAPFVGLNNFGQMFSDPYILTALSNNGRLLLLNWFIQLPLALILAYTLTRLHHGGKVYRFIFYIPVILPIATLALLWRFIFSGSDYGLLNNILKGLNLADWIRPWLSADGIVQWVTSIPSSWGGVGFYIIIFLAALVGIPDEFYEASAIDGANKLQQFFFITIPSIRGVYLYTMILGMQSALGGFIYPLLMTKGGPVHLSETLISYALYLLWQKKIWGYGSAVAVLSFLLGLVATALVWRIGRKQREIAAEV